MNLLDIVNRDPDPKPWSEVSKIPWDDPDFSARMLREHLSQDHDAASRRSSVIDQHVDWIHNRLLGGSASRILDLGCGPGLYCSRLARLGHRCTGIDFGPASIEHAREAAKADGLDCEYVLGDVRETSFGSDRDLIMMLFGELNTFTRPDALAILDGSLSALSGTGRVLLEVHTLDSIRERGDVPPTWTARERGLFSDRPHIRLDDANWQADSQTAVERHYVIDAETGAVTLYGTTTLAYTRDEYETLFRDAGLMSVQWHNDWPGAAESRDLELVSAGR